MPYRPNSRFTYIQTLFYKFQIHKRGLEVGEARCLRIEVDAVEAAGNSRGGGLNPQRKGASSEKKFLPAL
jgi:hypothetical protein